MSCSSPPEDDSVQSVKVAVRVRPMIGIETSKGCGECVHIVPGRPQVMAGSDKSFTLDHVYGPRAAQSSLYKDLACPLLDRVFDGFNATLFAYGQTGSGKTFTMGTDFGGAMADNAGGVPDDNAGVTPRVVHEIFARAATLAAKGTEVTVRVSMLELHNEEIRDLLHLSGAAASVGSGNGDESKSASIITTTSTAAAVPAGEARPAINIREDAARGVFVQGLEEKTVTNATAMMDLLSAAGNFRATASTCMNHTSSRSHAVCTISIEQNGTGGAIDGTASPQQQVGAAAGSIGASSTTNAADAADAEQPQFRIGKFHLVDLAGSERAKRTQAEGQRLREGININRGLLALGNVISALGDEEKRKAGAHVPYRDSKLTRLLQNSLGGNSCTVMIACVSPADVNYDESINTLRYANRARNIKNSPVVNLDPTTAEIARLRAQVLQLQAQVLQHRRMDSSVLASMDGGGSGSGGGGGGAGAGAGGGGPSGPEDKLRQLARLVEVLKSDKRRMAKEIELSKIRLARMTSARDVAQRQLQQIQQLTGIAGGKPSGLSSSPLPPPLPSSASPRASADPGMPLSSLSSSSSSGLQLRFSASSNVALAAFTGPNGSSTANGAAPAPLGINAEMDTEMDVDDDDDEEEDDTEDAGSKKRAKERELQALGAALAMKEQLVQQMVDASKGVDAEEAMRLYEETTCRLEAELKRAQAERDTLLAEQNKQQSQSQQQQQQQQQRRRAGDDGRLKQLEGQLKALRGKLTAQKKLLAVRERHEQTVAHLRSDIDAMKRAKVAMERRMTKDNEEARRKNKENKHALARLQREDQRKQHQLNKLESLQKKQQEVIKRKTEQAALAQRRLRESVKASSGRSTSSSSDAGGVSRPTASSAQRSLSSSSSASDGSSSSTAGGGGSGSGGSSSSSSSSGEVTAHLVDDLVSERLQLLRAQRSLREAFARREAIAKQTQDLKAEMDALPEDLAASGDRALFLGRLEDLQDEQKQQTAAVAVLQQRIADLKATQRHFRKGSSTSGGAACWSRVISLGQAKKAMDILLEKAVAGLNKGEETVAEVAKVKTEKRRLIKERRAEARRAEQHLLRLQAQHHEEVVFLLQQAEERSAAAASGVGSSDDNALLLADGGSGGARQPSAMAEDEKDAIIAQLRTEKAHLVDQLNFFDALGGGGSGAAAQEPQEPQIPIEERIAGALRDTGCPSEVAEVGETASEKGQSKGAEEYFDDTEGYDEEGEDDEEEYGETEEEEDDEEEPDDGEVDDSDDSDFDPDEEKNKKRKSQELARQRRRSRDAAAGKRLSSGSNAASTAGDAAPDPAGAADLANAGGNLAWIDDLKVKELQTRLAAYGLKKTGVKAVLQERLREHFIFISHAPPPAADEPKAAAPPPAASPKQAKERRPSFCSPPPSRDVAAGGGAGASRVKVAADPEASRAGEEAMKQQQQQQQQQHASSSSTGGSGGGLGNAKRVPLGARSVNTVGPGASTEGRKPLKKGSGFGGGVSGGGVGGGKSAVIKRGAGLKVNSWMNSGAKNSSGGAGGASLKGAASRPSQLSATAKMAPTGGQENVPTIVDLT